MDSISSRKKIIARLLVLTYLLIGAGLGNALILCQEAEAYSHLEYNVSGSCKTLCGSDAETGSRPVELPAWEDAGCLDTPLALSISHAQRTGVKTPEPRFLTIDRDTPGCPVAAHPASPRPSRPRDAHPLPARSLVALRTIVLLV